MSGEETPTWRYVVPGLLFAGMAIYLLWAGELAVDKQRTMIITRAANPLVYWLSVLVCGTVGFFALRKAWQSIRGA